MVSPLLAATPAPPVRPYLALGDSVSFTQEPALSMSTRTISSVFPTMSAWRRSSLPRTPPVREKRPAAFYRQLQLTMVVEPFAPWFHFMLPTLAPKLISLLLFLRHIQTRNW
jgi:hypothetical protein